MKRWQRMVLAFAKAEGRDPDPPEWSKLCEECGAEVGNLTPEERKLCPCCGCPPIEDELPGHR